MSSFAKPVLEASYIVFKQTINAIDYYFAQNGKTGAIDYGGQNNAGGVDGTNASVVIQSAINALSSGGKVFIKEGTYLLSTPIVIEKSDITLVGESWATILKVADGANCDAIVVGKYGYPFPTYYRNTIANLGIDGNKANQAAAATLHGIVVYRNDYTVVENCYIHDVDGTGIRFYATNRCIMRGNLVKDTTKYCYILENNAEYNVIEGNRGFTSTNWENMLLYGTDTGGVKYNTVVGNILDGAGYDTLTLANNSDFNTIIGNIIRNGSLRGIYLHLTSDGNVISNNIVENNNQHGIRLAGCSNNIITNNVILNNGQVAANLYDGINLVDENTNYCLNNIISNNRIYDNQATKTQRYGINEEGNSNYNKIVDNDVTGNLKTIAIVGANTKVQFNLGYVTENSGTISLVSGRTITTDLDITPNVVKLEAIGKVPVKYSHELSGVDIVAYHDQAPSTIDTRWYAGVV